MRLVQTAVALTALTWLAATPAIALELGGAKIRGNAEQTVTARTVLNVAAGSRAKAGQSIATVHNGAEIRGNLKQTVAARTVLNVAAGSRTTACQEIGTIGDNPACR
jgi:predicted nicotinamide N-methyase